MNVLDAAYLILSDNEGGAAVTPASVARADGHSEAKREALALLKALGYLQQDAEQGALSSTASDRATTRNRLALLRLASRLERLFQLPMHHAPGAVFLGGELSHAAFGLDRHGEGSVSVGGRGTSLRGAFESCIGEAAAYLSFIEWGDEPGLALATEPDGGEDPDELSAAARQTGLSEEYLAWSQAGIGLQPGTDPCALDWISAKLLNRDKTVLLPKELCLRRPRALAIGHRPAESNGVGAGTTPVDAMLDGLLEIVERDAAALWWYGGEPARPLSRQAAEHPAIRSLVPLIRGESDRQQWFLDLTGDIGIPVVTSLSCAADGSSVVSGFAAHPDITVAARGAFLEMCQMEMAQKIALMKLSQRGMAALGPTDRSWLDQHQRLTLDNFPRLRPQGAPRREHHTLENPASDRALQESIDRIAQAGFEPLTLDLTRESLAIPVYRVLVPGLQSAKIDRPSQRLAKVAARNCVDQVDWLQLPVVI